MTATDPLTFITVSLLLTAVAARLLFPGATRNEGRAHRGIAAGLMKPVSAKSLRVADRLAGARGARFVARRMNWTSSVRRLLPSGRPSRSCTCTGRAAWARRHCCASSRASPRRARPVIALDGRDIPRRDRQCSARSARRWRRRPNEERRPPARSQSCADRYLRGAGDPRHLAARDAAARPARRCHDCPGRTRCAGAGVAHRCRVVGADAHHRPGQFRARRERRFLESRGVAAGAHANVLDFTPGIRSRCRWWPTCSPNGRTRAGSIRSGAGRGPASPRAVSRHGAGRPTPRGAGRRRGRARHQRGLLGRIARRRGRTRGFRWLRRRHSSRAGPLGLFPHDLVREVLVADARGAMPTASEAVAPHRLALHAQVAAARGAERQRLQMDALYVTRSTEQRWCLRLACDDECGWSRRAADEGSGLSTSSHRHEGAGVGRVRAPWWAESPTASTSCAAPTTSASASSPCSISARAGCLGPRRPGHRRGPRLRRGARTGNDAPRVSSTSAGGCTPRPTRP